MGIRLVEIPRYLRYPESEDRVATRTGIERIEILTLFGNGHTAVVERLAVAYLQILVDDITLVDRQVQAINRVHTVHRLVALVVPTGMRIGITVAPGVGTLVVATNHIIYEEIRRIYIDEQLIYGVATRNGGVAVVVRTGGADALAVPCNSLIISQIDGITIVVRRTDIDNQLEGAVATVYRSEMVGIDAGGGDGLTAPVERRTGAELLVLGKGIVRMNRQTQHEGTVVAVHSAISLVVITAHAIVRATPVVGKISRTYLHNLLLYIYRVHARGEFVDRVTSADGLLTIIIRTGITNELSVPIDGLVVGQVNGVAVVVIGSLVEDDGIGAIAAKLGHIVSVIRTGHIQFLAVEEEGLTRTELCLIYLMVTRRTVDYQAEDTVATGTGMDGIEIDARFVVLVTEVVQFTFAYLAIFIDKVLGSDIQRQLQDGVAAAGRHERIVINTGLGQDTVAPFVTITRANLHILGVHIDRINRQVEDIDAVVAVYRGIAIVIGAAHGIGIATPGVCSTLAHREGFAFVEGGIYIQYQSLDAVATAQRTDRLFVDTRFAQHTTAPVVGLAIRDLYAGLIDIRRQMIDYQHIYRVATRRSIEAVEIDTRLGDGLTAEIKGLIGADLNLVGDEVVGIDRQGQFINGISTVGCGNGIVVDTRLIEHTVAPCIGCLVMTDSLRLLKVVHRILVQYKAID